MALVGDPATESTVRGIRKEISYINKYSSVDNMRGSLHTPRFFFNGRGNYIYVLCDTFVNFTLCAPKVCFELEGLLYIFAVQG